MEITQIKRMAAEIMKCGVTRIKITNMTDALQAMTKDDVRGLIKRDIVIRIPEIGTSRARARKIALQKHKGRRKNKGSRKGTSTARTPKKRAWMTRVRGLRKELKNMKSKLTEGTYRKLYNRIKGGFFKTKGRLKGYAEEKKLLK